MSSSTRELSSANAGSTPGAILSNQEIDASCRFPVLFLFTAAAAWFLISAVFGLIGSIKLHSPNFLSACDWLTYGRIRPVQLDSMLYGFAVQSALAITIWLFCRLGKAKLVAPLLPLVAGIIWNIGLIAGTTAVLVGDNTGIEWLEYPRHSVAILFVAYGVIAIWAVLNFHARRQHQLFPSQWYLLAALFWFAWIYSAANMLLIFAPVRGVVQICVNAWYSSNLLNVWLSAIGLGTLFYFLPKLTNRPLYSYYIALFTFWTIALFGGWGFINTNAPLPSWIPSLSAVLGWMMLLPIISVALNVRKTVCGFKSTTPVPLLSLMRFGAFSFVIAQLMNVVMAIRPLNEVLAFTYFPATQVYWQLIGFFACIAIGAIYYILPLILNTESVAVGKVRLQTVTLVGAVLFYGVALIIGGVIQGTQLNNANIVFADVIKSTFPWLHISTIGSLLLVIAGLLLLFNLVSFTARACCACCKNSGKPGVRS